MGLYLRADEEVTFLCRKEELKIGSLVDWLGCYCRKDRGRECMLMKLICSVVSSNQSSSANEYPDCGEGGGEASLLVSPLMVAGIVIGLVLFLSCVTIIVGSLRKDGRLRSQHLPDSYAPDGYSYGGSIGELRSTCAEEFPPPFDFDSYVEILSQVDVMYPNSPPLYEECVGPGAALMYVLSDDPPPYSLTDPCLGGRDWQEPHSRLEVGAPTGAASWMTGGGASGRPLRRLPLASISSSALPLEDAPPYEAVMTEQNQPIPLIPLDPPKHTSAEPSPLQAVTHRIL